MTPIILLECLEEFVKENIADIKLQVRVTNTTPGEMKERAAEVHTMRLEKKDDKIQRIPYVLIQLLKFEDNEEQPANTPTGMTQIRFVVATYSEDGKKGSYDVLNILLRIRGRLLAAGVIGNQFEVKKPLEAVVYTDNTEPYFFGEMIANFTIPTIQREVNFDGY